MADISIPEGDNPVRYQASLGGNQKYRNMGNISGQAYLVRGQVTNVYYQKGTLDFNTYGSSVTSGVTDGSGSAPIPVDFWGKNTDGKVFGCYRPVQKGSQILVAYIGGDTSRPIVIGVYPDNESSYELISPVHYNTGDDSTDDVQNDALGERKIYPNQQMMYESGKGDILRSMGGKSFLYISENGSGYLDDINYAYNEISDFYDADANEIEPTMTKAQSWLLVHEDNDSDEAADGHRTRFYVNRSGELMVTFANKDDPNNIVVLEASKDSGFKLTKRFDNSNIKEDSEDYVQFGIGNGNNVSIKSVDSGDATSFYLDNDNIKFNTPKKGSITFDGISVNAILGKVSDAESSAQDAADKADKAADKADIAATAGEHAKSAASEAASQALAASYAGEDAKSAAVEAKAAGEDAKAQSKDTQDRIIYYASISNEKDVAVPGKYIIVNTDTYIANGTIKTAHIGDAAITNAKIADLSVGTAQLEDAAITRAKIGNLAVGTAQIEDAAITDAKVGNLSANHLNAGTIDFSVISGIHINASEIDVGKIVADQIYVNGLGDISKNLGTVTSGKITGTNINSDVDNLNDPNLMNVIEKQTAVSQYAGLTSQYNVILARAKDANISTTDLTIAYTNLNTFMAALLTDTAKASDIDRYTYNSFIYDYNAALSNVQTALKNSFNSDIDNMQSSVSVASQAASSAVIVASQAAITGDTANQVASRAIVVANDAQSAGNNAISVANNASQAASGAVIAGSTASVNADKAVKVASQAQIAGNNATSVANNASQAASGAVIAGSTATVIANKASTVANEAKSAGDNATSVANNATSVANSARSVADNTYDYANSEISIQSTATAKAQSTADNAFSQAQAVGSRADSEIAVNSMATVKAQSTADNAFSQAQAVGSQASAEISNNSTATAKAQSTADNAFSKAQEVGSQASAEINSNSTATATAQSTADNAFSQATTAIDNGKVTSQAVTDLKDGSKLTIAELENGLATKVANSDYASYKEQTASQIGQLVTNGAFSAYQTQTADLIAQKVATSDFSAYQATTAKSIDSKVESNDFNTYKTQTADLIDDKVSNSAYASDKTQTASEIADRVSNSAFSTYQTQTASQIASKVDNGDFSTYKTQTANLIGSKVDNGVYQSDKTQTANAISSKVSSSDFNTYKTQTADLIDDKVSNSAYASDNTQTASEIADRVSNSAFSTYQTQTASQIAQKVDSGAFSAYQQTTADLISSKVATKDFSAYQATTATAIDSKVESSDFNTYKTQTADLIDDKVSSSEYASDKTQTASEIADRVSNSAFSTYQTQTASQIAQKVDNGAFSTYKTQTADLIASKVATKDFSAYQATTAKSIESKVESSNFNTYKSQTADVIASKVESKDFQALQTQVDNSAVGTNLLLNTSDYSTNWTWDVNPSIDTTQKPAILHYPSTTITSGASVIAQQNIGSILQPSTTYTASFYAKGSGNFKFFCYPGVTSTTISVNGIVVSSTSSDCSTIIPLTPSYVRYTITFTTLSSISDSKNFLLRQDYNSSDTSFNTVEAYVYGIKIEKGSVATDWSLNPEEQATQSQITQLSGEIDLRVTKGDLVDQINIQAGKTLISSSGQLILSGKSVVLDSVDPVIMKSANIGNLAVGTAQIANGAITNAQIGSLAVDTANIKDAAISSAKIASLAVGTAQIGDGAITNAKIANLAVGTAQIANGAITNAQIGNEAVGTAQIGKAAVGTAQIADLAVGTAQIGDGAITNAKIGHLAVGTAQIANAAITDAQIDNVSANKLTAGTIDFNTITGKNINAANITTGILNTDRLNVNKLSALSADLGDITTGTLKGVNIVADSFSTPNGSFTTDASGSVVASNLTIRGVTNLVYNAALLGGSGSNIPGWAITNNGCYLPGNTHDGVPSIGWNNTTGVWNLFAQTKLYPLNGATGQPFSASVWFSDFGSDTSLTYQFTLAFFDSNGNRIDGYAQQNWNGTGSAQGWRYVTIDNAVAPSNAVSVGLEYWSYNGHGNACFSSPMLTQTAQSTGYQPDVGNVVNAGIINGSIINAGSRIDNSNNTSNWYPLTINPNGDLTSTYMDNNAGLQTYISGGAVETRYNEFTANGNGQYTSHIVDMGADGSIAVLDVRTANKDTAFNAPTASIYGAVYITASGISLYGTNQSLLFNGTDKNGTNGISMDSYGNLNANDTQGTWYLGHDNSNQTANFGIDSAGINEIYFNRQVHVGAVTVSTGGTFALSNGGDFWFGKSTGGFTGIHAGTVNYTSLVKSSLLSVKRDVKKADTSYWAQLVNSIDLATYQYKSDDNTSHIRLSSIVDDVNDTKQWRLPDVFISRDENGKLSGVDDSVLLNAILATVQEQQKEIDQLNGHNMELEARLNKLEAKLNG